MSVRVRRVFEDINRDQTTALVSQFQRAFDERAGETAAAIEHVAESDQLHRTTVAQRSAHRPRTMVGERASDGVTHRS